MMGRVWARPTVTRLAWWLAGILVVAACVVVRVVSEGRAELAASDAAWASGNALDATVHARAAARAYVPGASHVAQGYRRLRTIAQDSEARGDTESALFAWRAVRSAAIGSRSVLSSHAREREVADAAIVRLSSASRSDSNRVERMGAIGAAFASALSADVPPRGIWGALLVVGAVLWMAAGFRLTEKAWDASGTFRLAGARAPLALAALGLVVWWVALLMA